MTIYPIEKIWQEPPPEIKYIYDYWVGEYEPMFMKLKGFIDTDINFYVVSHDWRAFEEYLEKNKVYGEDGELLDRSNLGKYLKDFAEGFFQGYHDFDKEIKHSTSIFNDSEIIAKKVFSQILSIPKWPLRSWASNLRYLNEGPESCGENVGKLRPGGIETGKLYKAWYYIVSNPELFKALFRERFYPNYKVIRGSWSIDYKTDLDALIEEIEGATKTQNLPEPPAPTQGQKKKYLAKYYVLTYILDADVAGRSRPNANEKTKLEGIGARYFERIDINLSGNTFAKNYKKILSDLKIDINSKRDLIDYWCEDWREIVLSLSENRNELDNYLKNKHL